MSKAKELKDEMKEMVLAIVPRIVDHPDEVRVDVVSSRYRMVVELYTAEKDVGQVIGRGGQVADAVRLIMSAFAGKYKVQVDLDYVTEQESDYMQSRRARYHGQADEDY